MKKMKKLNMRGFSHDVVAVLFVVVFAIAGIAYLVGSHADSVTSQAPAGNWESLHGPTVTLKGGSSETVNAYVCKYAFSDTVWRVGAEFNLSTPAAQSWRAYLQNTPNGKAGPVLNTGFGTSAQPVAAFNTSVNQADNNNLTFSFSGPGVNKTTLARSVRVANLPTCAGAPSIQPPTNLTATKTPTSLSLTWQGGSAGKETVKDFIVSYENLATHRTLTYHTNGPVDSYQLIRLQAGATYAVTVRTQPGGVVDQNFNQSAQHASAITVTLPVPKLSPPTDLSAAVPGNGSITIDWQPGAATTTPVTGYRLYFYPTNAGARAASDSIVAAPSLSVHLTNLKLNAKYSYYVREFGGTASNVYSSASVTKTFTLQKKGSTFSVEQ
jgi:hypothetical protein